MPKRGSVQLLLLLLRPRATLGWGMGAAVAIGLVAGLVPLNGTSPLLDKAGIAQTLRQGAWEKALAGQSTPARWPWQDMSENMSFAPGAKVPRLGLSAAMLNRADEAPQAAVSEPYRSAQTKTDKGVEAAGDVALSDVAIGDSITFTAADGATCVYRVTGRRVVDPHLAEGEAMRADGETSLFNCGPLDRLIMQATQGALTQGEPPVAPQAADDQQKL
jgi:hypothetical protein